jgi:hypothetical protein
MGLSEDPERGRRQSGQQRLITHVRPGTVARQCVHVTSAAVDLHVTQVVDGVKGVHATPPKAFEAAK